MRKEGRGRGQGCEGEAGGGNAAQPVVRGAKL